MSINFESNYLLPNISDQLYAYQKDRVSLMIRDFIETNRQMNQFHFEYCPKCGQFHPVLVKAGKTKAGKQMLKCTSCHKQFVAPYKHQVLWYRCLYLLRPQLISCGKPFSTDGTITDFKDIGLHRPRYLSG